MKKFRTKIFLAALVIFSFGLQKCTVTPTCYCQKQEKNMHVEKTSSDVFPDSDLIIKI
jgi:hypothetical protein